MLQENAPQMMLCIKLKSKYKNVCVVSFFLIYFHVF